MTWHEYCLSKLDYAKSLYSRIMKKKWDFNNPQTFTEKLWWLGIYDCIFLKSYCADKITIHNYCIEKLGKDICIPIINIYDIPEQIDWNILPNQFVIKCNHGSGYNIIVKDKTKLNKNDTIQKLKKWLSEDYSQKLYCELHYHNIPHKILIEEYKENHGKTDLTDYKFYCFNGKPTFCQIITDRHSGEKISHYDLDWNYKPELDWINFNSDSKIQKPKFLKEMIDYATILSKDFKFVRVDFYEIENKLYLGELTFTPMGGDIKYKNKDTDLKLGKLLQL